MDNKAMQRKLDRGACLDISNAERLGPYYVIDDGDVIDGVDLCDARTETWIWSVGRAERDMKFKRDGVEYVVHEGQVLASTAADLYQADGFECLWLR